jgi:hypothetical protein
MKKEKTPRKTECMLQRKRKKGKGKYLQLRKVRRGRKKNTMKGKKRKKKSKYASFLLPAHFPRHATRLVSDKPRSFVLIPI